jgi:hypothetical protein
VEPRLDDLIAEAAPPVARRSDALRRELDTLVAESEAAARPRPRRSLGRRVGLAGLTAAGVLGLGAAASAAGLLPMPWYDDPSAIRAQHVLSSGRDCAWTFSARETEDGAHPVGPADRAAALAAAKRFLADLDLSGISVAEAVRKYEAADRAYRSSSAYRDLPASERQPRADPDDVEFLAVAAELDERLAAELTRQGLSPHAVSVAAASRCDGDAGGR